MTSFGVEYAQSDPKVIQRPFELHDESTQYVLHSPTLNPFDLEQLKIFLRFDEVTESLKFKHMQKGT